MTSLEATTGLLQEVFPQHPKYLNQDYLEWEYRMAPSGQVIEANLDDEIGRCGHYAVVPQQWQIDGVPCVYGLSLNTAVSERSRGQGVFGYLGRKDVAEARENGYTALVGVANSESTHGMVNSLGFEMVRQLPVVVVPSIGRRRTHSYEVGTEEDICLWLRDSTGPSLPEGGAQRMWDSDELAWRLADPAHDYRVLLSDDVGAVVHSASYRGIRIAVIVKVFIRESVGDIDICPLARAACSTLRSPLALYAGYNPRLLIKGFPLPGKVRPSPLNLIVKCLVDEVNPSSVVPNNFEFLDFDAY